MNPLRLAVVAIILLGACGCRSEVEQAEPAGKPDGTVPIRAVWHSNQCVSDEAKIEPITTQATLEKWWQPFARLQFPAKALPQDLGAINFDESALFAIFMGSRPTAGYGIELHADRAQVRRASLTIPATWQVPTDDMTTAQIATSPCIIVTVPAQPYRRVTVRDQRGNTLLDAGF